MEEDKTLLEELEKTRKKAIKEGKLVNLAVGLGDQYISPFAIALKVPTFILGLLTSFPNLFGPLFQILGNYFLIKGLSRQKILFFSTLTQSIIYFAISLFAFTYLFKINLNFYILILLFTLYVAIGSLAAPSWVTWFGDISQKKEFGSFMGKRNSLGTFFNILGIVIAGILLEIGKNIGNFYLFLFFGIIFLGSAFFLFLRSLTFLNVYDPKFTFEKKDYFTFIQFLKRLPKGNFGRFVIFTNLVIFASFLSLPYYNLYLFNDLKLSYFKFLTLIIVSSFFSFLFYKIWGKVLDQFGSLSVLKISLLIISLVAILWFFILGVDKSLVFVYLIFINIIGSIGWSAYYLSTTDFFYSSVTKGKRGLCSAYSSVISGIMIFLGTTIGGYLVDLFRHNIWINSVILLSTISGILRLTFALGIFLLVKDPSMINFTNGEESKEDKINYSLLKEIYSIKNLIILEFKNLIIHPIAIVPLALKRIYRKRTKKAKNNINE